MKSRDKQLRRMVKFIEEVKKGNYPNSRTFSEKLRRMDQLNNTDLAVCSKTIKRDIEYLKNTIGAPLEYDRSEHGFFLYMRDWTFPELALSGNELFAELFTRQISMQSVLPSLKEHLATGLDVQMTVGETEDVNVSALSSVIYATDKSVKVEEEISDTILEAWKSCITIDATYAKSRKEISERKLDIHALFLSEKIWYCRAFCHERQDFRNFALHKFQSAEMTKDKFSRSKSVIKKLKQGNIFNYKTIAKVEVQCDESVASYIVDREWFSGQENIENEDGTYSVVFKNVPEQAVKSWIMSFGGQVSVFKPDELREDIRKSAEELLNRHK